MGILKCTVTGKERESSNVHEIAPLQQISVTGLIRDTVAQYTLVQTYTSPLIGTTIEAVYTFPLYEGVAVSGFEAEVDGRRIIGRVLEKVAARKEYQEAVQAKKVASLLDHERSDVFQASIGNIPPAKEICIRITLVSEIKHDADENQVRFVLPTAIAPRGGASPVSASNVNSSASKLSVSMACAMSKPITSIQSPSHNIEVHLGSTSAASTSPDSFEPSRARVSLAANSLLDKDLVVIIQSLELDAPRAFVESHPTDGTHAVSLTFSPRFLLNSIRNSELIFLVDRSASTTSSQIKQAKEALELFLRSIPLEGHFFNVIGLGSSHKALFPKSVAYNAESLKTGISYAQTLKKSSSDAQSPSLHSALLEAFQRRRRDIPTQIFLLTSGQIWDVDTLVECIRGAVEEGERSSSLVRVFSLGVGASVSHHLVESVARAGGGYAQVVVEGERIEKKIVNMVREALMPPVTNVDLQWISGTAAAVEDVNDEDFEMVEDAEESKMDSPSNDNKPIINLFDTSPQLVSPPLPPPTPLPDVVTSIQQAPFKVPSLHRGARITVYAILSATTPVPPELVLKGSSPDGPVELRVNVESVQEGETTLHALAARALVRDLEEASSCIHALGRAATEANEQMLKRLGVQVVAQEGKKYKDLPLSRDIVSDITKQKILDLALKYNLSSKCSSWVAFDTESQQSIVSTCLGISVPHLAPDSTSLQVTCAPEMACAPPASDGDVATQGPAGGI